MSVLPFQPRGHWAWDARGAERAVRVSPHPDENVVNLSVWRDDLCVGTVRLLPDEVSALVAGLTDGLVELSRRPAGPAATVADLEERLARVESRLTRPTWRTTATAAATRVRSALHRAANYGSPPAP
jgi:hypothetical protein